MDIGNCPDRVLEQLTPPNAFGENHCTKKPWLELPFCLRPLYDSTVSMIHQQLFPAPSLIIHSAVGVPFFVTKWVVTVARAEAFAAVDRVGDTVAPLSAQARYFFKLPRI